MRIESLHVFELIDFFDALNFARDLLEELVRQTLLDRYPAVRVQDEHLGHQIQLVLVEVFAFGVLRVIKDVALQRLGWLHRQRQDPSQCVVRLDPRFAVR